MIEMIKNMPKINKYEKTFNLYQLQIEGLRKGWLIYPRIFNPLTLIIKKKSRVTSEVAYPPLPFTC